MLIVAVRKKPNIFVQKHFKKSLLLFFLFQEVKLHDGKPDKNSSVDLDDMEEKAVVHEFFHSIVREVRDEVSWCL